MHEPGGLIDLGSAGRELWSHRLVQAFEEVSQQVGASPVLHPEPAAEPTAVAAPDWLAYPARVAGCLGRAAAAELLDRPILGRSFQEEYCEWRTLRDGTGAVQRVELTTELAAYWRLLAAHNPRRTLELVAEFAGQEEVPGDAVYGLDQPEAATANARECGFVETMLSPTTPNPYNWGERAICCMIQETNKLLDLLFLAVAAAKPRLIEDVEGRAFLPTAAEAIPPVPAQLCRSSDPVLVERLGRLAYEGRHIAFADPLGVYIVGTEHERLRAPGGEAVPAEWFAFGRGTGAEDAADHRTRYQRLVFEVPAEADFAVGDLVDVATEQPITSGAQIADLVQLVLYLRVSEANVVGIEPELVSPAPQQDPCRCYALAQDTEAVLGFEEGAQ